MASEDNERRRVSEVYRTGWESGGWCDGVDVSWDLGSVFNGVRARSHRGRRVVISNHCLDLFLPGCGLQESPIHAQTGCPVGMVSEAVLAVDVVPVAIHEVGTL